MISLLDAESHWSEVIEQNHFPDGTLHINMPPNYFDYDTIVWDYENDAELFTLICVKGHFEDLPVTLDMPYFSLRPLLIIGILTLLQKCFLLIIFAQKCNLQEL